MNYIRTEEHKDKMRQIILKVYKTNPHSEESRKRQAEAITGRPSPKKGRKEGHHSEEHIKKISLAQRGEKNSFYGKSHSEKVKRDIGRKSSVRIAQRLIEGGVSFPNYNKKACEFFKSFDEQNNTRGRYATNGGEHFIKELGYWLDYFNPDKKLIIEWDEKHHFDENGILKEKDRIRQVAIQGLYSDFEFRRIKQKEDDLFGSSCMARKVLLQTSS